MVFFKADLECFLGPPFQSRAQREIPGLFCLTEADSREVPEEAPP